MVSACAAQQRHGAPRACWVYMMPTVFCCPEFLRAPNLLQELGSIGELLSTQPKVVGLIWRQELQLALRFSSVFLLAAHSTAAAHTLQWRAPATKGFCRSYPLGQHEIWVLYFLFWPPRRGVAAIVTDTAQQSATKTTCSIDIVNNTEYYHANPHRAKGALFAAGHGASTCTEKVCAFGTRHLNNDTYLMVLVNRITGILHMREREQLTILPFPLSLRIIARSRWLKICT